MNKTLTLFMIAMFAVALGLGSFAPTVIADSNSDKLNSNKVKVQEFSGSSVLQSSSTTLICHVPKGDPGNSHEIVVSTSSLTAHQKHGDTIGSC